jgi:hypothetical protein
MTKARVLEAWTRLEEGGKGLETHGRSSEKGKKPKKSN